MPLSHQMQRNSTTAWQRQPALNTAVALGMPLAMHDCIFHDGVPKFLVFSASRLLTASSWAEWAAVRMQSSPAQCTVMPWPHAVLLQ